MDFFSEKHSCDSWVIATDSKSLIFCLADGIHHLHKNGIAHRDIKPSNIMLLDNSDDVTVKIVDYDLAKEDYSPQWVGQLPCGTTGTDNGSLECQQAHRISDFQNMA